MIKKNPLLAAFTVGLLTFGINLAQADVDRRSVNSGNLILEDVPPIPQSIVDDLNRYQNVRSANFREWSADGESLYISTRFGDVSQIHQVKQAGGARFQLTFFDEPVGSVSRRSGSDDFAFTMDAGGSEFAQIFLFDRQSGESKMLSDGESRNGVLQWSHKGDQLAFQSTRRNGASNDVWLMSPDAAESARVVLEAPDGTWWGPIAFNGDDTKLLVLNYISSTQSHIHLVDIKSGERQALSGESNSVNMPLDFDHQAKGFFFLTDRFGEMSQLAWAPLAEPENITAISRDIPWEVDGFSLSPKGDRAAFAINADGISELYLLDTKNFQYKKVDSLPIGLVDNFDFSPDGSKLAMTLDTAKTPSDTFVLALGKRPTQFGQLTRWTFSEVGGLDTEQFQEPQLVHFPTFDKVGQEQRKIPAFVYKPAGKGPFPVVISIHGGPESQSRPGFYSTYQMWMQKLGVAVVVPNVRGSDGYGKTYLQLDNGFKREDSVKDIGALLDWIATQKDLDKNRVAVFGGSYGGYMVLASAVHYSDRLKAAVDIVGISSFVTFLENTQDYRRDLRRVEYGDERDPAMRAHLEKISPVNNVDKISVPMFVIQGQNDPRVPVTEAEQIVAALREKGQPVWYMNALNEGHGYRKKENRDVYQQAVVLFLKKYLQ